MTRSPGDEAAPISDAALEKVEGGVYIQEIPSGATARRKGALLFDEADAVTPLASTRVVFEPNDEH